MFLNWKTKRYSFPCQFILGKHCLETEVAWTLPATKPLLQRVHSCICLPIFNQTVLKLVIRSVAALLFGWLTDTKKVIEVFTTTSRVPCALQAACCIKLTSPLIFRLPLSNKEAIRYTKWGLHRDKAVLTYNSRAFSYYLTHSTEKQYPLQAVKETSSWFLP